MCFLFAAPTAVHDLSVYDNVILNIVKTKFSRRPGAVMTLFYGMSFLDWVCPQRVVSCETCTGCVGMPDCAGLGCRTDIKTTFVMQNKH